MKENILCHKHHFYAMPHPSKVFVLVKWIV